MPVERGLLERLLEERGWPGKRSWRKRSRFWSWTLLLLIPVSGTTVLICIISMFMLTAIIIVICGLGSQCTSFILAFSRRFTGDGL